MIDTTERPSWRYARTPKNTTPPLGKVLVGDALTELCRLPAASFDVVVTSPPYHLLRRYGLDRNEIGTEADVETYVKRIVDVCDEIARVLAPHGSLWLNLGDSYSRAPRYGAPTKSLLLAPERILVQLVDQGWRLRNKVVWAKTNPMPASVADRFSTTWEPLYLLVKNERYYFDLDAIREPHRTVRKPRPLKTNAKYGGSRPSWAGPLAGINDGLERTRAEGRAGHPLGKNPGDVWRLATAGYQGDHFAVFPEGLVRRPLAACPERVCTACGRPWQRERRRDRLGELRPSCRCQAGWRNGRVLDPFIGSGTVAIAAEQAGRDWLGIELHSGFAAMTRRRVADARQKRSSNERRSS